MRILHTSDWHLGRVLYGKYDRSDELFRQVEYIGELTRQHNVDVLLVAGDIFHRYSPELTRRLAKTLSPYIQEGLHVILVPGNHDNREHFTMMRALLSLEQGESDRRVHIVQTREIIPIKGVQFAILPYPIRENLEPPCTDAVGKTTRNVVLSNAYARLVRSMTDALDPSRPAVFVAHINVAGVTTPSEKELGYDEDIRLGRSDLPVAPNLAYIALGHIHQQQEIPHAIPCWYSGNIERLDMGERNDTKGVLIVDIPEHGIATVTTVEQEQSLRLTTSSFYDIQNFSTLDLAQLPELYPDLENAFVKLHLELQPGDDPMGAKRQADELAKRWHFRLVDVSYSGQEISRTMTAVTANPHDRRETVMEYLQDRFGDRTDLQELKIRALVLMNEVNDAITQD